VVRSRETAPAPTAEPGDPPSVEGVAEVVDTTTLRVGAVVVHLAGIEWARGGRADDLRRYLGDRRVRCERVEDSSEYRCRVGDQDLSRVVLYNGGARAEHGAAPELRDAEAAAREARRGVWAAQAP
jgi:endonuclease YncB( thermonuclease family)